MDGTVKLEKYGTPEGALLGWKNRKANLGGQLKTQIRESAGLPSRYTAGRKRQLEGQRDAIDKLIGGMSDQKKIETIKKLMNMTSSKLKKQVEEIIRGK